MSTRLIEGCITALTTEFGPDGKLDLKRMEQLIAFQVGQGINGLLMVGTTGESPTLSTKEHCQLVAQTCLTAHRTAKQFCRSTPYLLAGTGSNCTDEAIALSLHAVEAGADGILLVDPYYNGPASFHIVAEYYLRIAAILGCQVDLLPYAIPGRTGCVANPADIVAAAEWTRNQPNCGTIVGVKEATGDLERMALTRLVAGAEFVIMSGDDDKTLPMILDPRIAAQGVISVMSNIVPAAICEMVRYLRSENRLPGQRLAKQLEPLFKLVGVTADREVLAGGRLWRVTDKFRNPGPVKTMMAGLGMSNGTMRSPLGLMTAPAVEQVRAALQQVWQQSPELLEPIEAHFGVSISKRLANDAIWARLSATPNQPAEQLAVSA